MYDPRMDGEDAMSTDGRTDTRLTYDDFLLFPDDGMRHEIIEGEHLVTPSPSRRHQDLVGRLHLALGNFLTARQDLGQVYLAPFDVVLSRWDVVEPDLLLVAADQLDIVTEENVQGSPALVVEVVSPGTRKRDEQTKRRLFERTAVREYWLVDPELDVVKVFRRAGDGSFPRVAELEADRHDVLTTPLLPGFSYALDKLFA
jgi:Uma2 family endonuclease